MNLTILMPCLNEALTLPRCISKAQQFLNRTGFTGEVLIADNGSTDGSQALAQRLGARVIAVNQRGYGAALQAGLEAAHGRWVIMGDADDSYDFSSLDGYVTALQAGAELVMGNRFQGGIEPGAMPPLHRWLGNPVLSFIGRLFFKSPVRDFHCGLRGGDRQALLSLQLRCVGMEYASEMVVKASLRHLKIVEVPTKLHKDGRDRPPHLRTWRDGWRHLRFLLMMCPRWLFLWPGLFLSTVGVVGTAVLSHGMINAGGLGLGIHTLLYATEAALLGWQLLLFYLLARSAGAAMQILPLPSGLERLLQSLTLERGLILGSAMFLVGLWLSWQAVQSWGALGWGALDPTQTMRLTIPAAGLMLAGAELAFASFVLHFILQIHRK
jgi:glycosyltransferase involved in cell wall biosynthesis